MVGARDLAPSSGMGIYFYVVVQLGNGFCSVFGTRGQGVVLAWLAKSHY